MSRPTIASTEHLSRRAKNALYRNGFSPHHTPTDVAAVPDERLRSGERIGRATYAEIRQWLGRQKHVYLE